MRVLSICKSIHFATVMLTAFMFHTTSFADEPDFTKEIRPILTRYCFKCHGPDERHQKADLRLDNQESAHKSVIVPGNPDKSELVRRIFSDKRFVVMPPPKTKTALTDKQKNLLKAWIKAGAKYEEHWAFVKPSRPPLPKVERRDWPNNPIDYFVLSKLKANGLQPSPPASRYTLIRRLSLDLIGLPPTPEEVDAFVNDTSPNAYERLVDRLLASPRYGELWARRWLDLARYADTNGYEKDRARTIWPYRDWVIQALNADMPFDQFTTEQLAGDLLPKPTPKQFIATGFHRNTMINEEGGVDPLEFRYYAVVDRVNTTATTWLGLTLGCAQCHSHKYDPISHTEYFQMMAFLNNADEPDYDIPDERIKKRRAGIKVQVAQLMQSLPKQYPGGQPSLMQDYREWKKTESARAVSWTALRPSEMKSNLPYFNILEDDSVLVGGDQTKSDRYRLRFSEKIKGVTAIRLEALPHESLPNHGPGRTYYEGRKGDFFLSELSVTVGGKAVAFAGASHDHANGAFRAGKVGAQFCFDGKPQTGWSTTNQPGIAHEAVFNLATPTDFDGDVSMGMLFERHYSCGLGRFRISVTTDAAKAQATSHGREIDAILAKMENQRTAENERKLFGRFLEVAPELKNGRKQIEILRKSTPEFQTTMVMKERPQKFPRPTHRHHRGEYLQPKEDVQPGVLSALQPIAKNAPPNRLGLARWLTSPENPLTARVTMNRQWQAFFGRGIVRTSEDFGIQGELPTHPKLLDWLATEFIRQGWSQKAMHKFIVMSATYQQSSRIAPELLAKDPQNELLTRGPRVRIEAEMVRDSLLQASGLLSQKMHGPSVFPPQPSSVTLEGVYGPIKWKVSKGEDRYRRGMYTFLKRSIPYAMFATFDGATGEYCLSRREVSNTPLQALTMLNDTVVLEAAQVLGRQIAAMEGTDEQRLTMLFRRCLVRPPSAAERGTLIKFYRRQLERLRGGDLDAKKIAGGEGGDVVQRAAWTLVTRVVFNLGEMVVRE